MNIFLEASWASEPHLQWPFALFSCNYISFWKTKFAENIAIVLRRRGDKEPTKNIKFTPRHTLTLPEVVLIALLNHGDEHHKEQGPQP